MAVTVQAILTKVTEIASSLQNIAGDVQALKDALAQGGIVTQQDLDQIMLQLSSVAQAASDLDTQNP